MSTYYLTILLFLCYSIWMKLINTEILNQAWCESWDIVMDKVPAETRDIVWDGVRDYINARITVQVNYPAKERIDDIT